MIDRIAQRAYWRGVGLLGFSSIITGFVGFLLGIFTDFNAATLSIPFSDAAFSLPAHTDGEKFLSLLTSFDMLYATLSGALLHLMSRDAVLPAHHVLGRQAIGTTVQVSYVASVIFSMSYLHARLFTDSPAEYLTSLEGTVMGAFLFCLTAGVSALIYSLNAHRAGTWPRWLCAVQGVVGSLIIGVTAYSLGWGGADMGVWLSLVFLLTIVTVVILTANIWLIASLPVVGRQPTRYGEDTPTTVM